MNLLEWRVGHFSLIAEFQILGSEISGMIANIYGPSAFPQKQAFIHHLRWPYALAQEGRWIIGGYFNLITSLQENKVGRRNPKCMFDIRKKGNQSIRYKISR